MEKQNLDKKKQKFIPIPYGASKKLEVIFECSAPTVRDALNYKTNTELAIRIREYAMAQYESKAIIIKKARTKRNKSKINP